MQLLPIHQDGSVQNAGQDPSGSVPDVAGQMAALYQRRGFEPPWIGYVAVEDGVSVGTCAFTGPPAGGEAEIAYFTFPGNEGNGVATRMVRTLLAQTAQEADARHVTCIAHTLPQEGASTQVLRRLGFILEGAMEHPEDGTVWKWRKAQGKPHASC